MKTVMFPDKVKAFFYMVGKPLASIGRKVIRHGLAVVLSAALLLTSGAVIYIGKLLYQSAYIKVPIVDDLSIPSGMLDDLSDPEDDLFSDDTGDSTQDSSGSKTGGSGTRKPSYWGEGRIRVYVDSRFPIRRVAQKDPNIENFLLFGLDAQSSYDTRSRADSIIIASVDKRTNSIKLTSIMRDTQVRIPGRTAPNKINAAYVFGGVGLLINTINQTFDLDIQKFAMVDFWSSEQVINALGGVYIDVTEDELPYINAGVSHANFIFKNISDASPKVNTAGNVLLNGRQAVAYGRIRRIGSDTARTQRQRNVLTQAIIQFKQAPPSRKLAVFEEGSKSFETNVPRSEMLFLAFDLLQTMKNIRQYRVPEYGMYTSNTVNYQLSINYSLQLPALHRFIWGDDIKHAIILPEELPEPTPTPIPTSIPTPTPTPTPNLSPTLTPVLTPTSIPTQAQQATPSPSITTIPSDEITPTGSAIPTASPDSSQ